MRDHEVTRDSWPFPPISFRIEAARTALLVIDMQYHDAHRDYGVGRALERGSPGFTQYYFHRVERVVTPGIRRLLEAFRAAKDQAATTAAPARTSDSTGVAGSPDSTTTAGSSGAVGSAGPRVIYLCLGAELEDLADMPPTARARSRARALATGFPTLYPRSSFEYQILPELAPCPGELVINKTSLGAFNSTALDFTLRNLGVEALVVTGVVTSVCVETTARDAVDRGYNVVLVDDACASWDEEGHQATLRAFQRYFGRVATVDEMIAELGILALGEDVPARMKGVR